MFPEYLLRAGFSITARAEVTAALEEVLHKRAPHWDKCMDSHGKDCNRHIKEVLDVCHSHWGGWGLEESPAELLQLEVEGKRLG